MDFQSSTLEINTHVGCPVACVYCPQGKTVKNYKGERNMSVETLSKCLDKVPIRINNKGQQYPRIEFSAFVEPFTNPHCADLINVVYDKGFRDITLYTTFRGVKLSDYEKIKHIPFTFVSIHLPDEDGLAKIPVDETYFKLLELFLKTFTVGFFVYGKLRKDVMDFLLKLYPDAATGRFKWQVEIHDRAGNLDNVAHREPLKGHIQCNAVPHMEMNHNILMPNGDVALCCMDFGLDHIVGNLLTGEYDDIFKSDEHNRVVAGMYVEDIKTLCRKCAYAIPNLRN